MKFLKECSFKNTFKISLLKCKIAMKKVTKGAASLVEDLVRKNAKLSQRAA